MTDFEFTFGAPGRSAPRRRDSATMRILVLADCRGANTTRPPLAQRQPRKIDIDNFESLMKRWSPTVNLTIADPPLAYVCPTLEHFEPDTLIEQLPQFDALRHSGTGAAPAADLVSTEDDVESAQDTVGRLLGGDTGAASRKPAGAGLLDNFIGKLVADDIAPAAASSQAHTDAFAAAAGALLRTILHDPHWQRLEATWRGLHAIVTGVDAADSLSIHVLDVTADEMTTDLLGGDRQNSALVTRLVEEGTGSFGGEPWDVIVADLAVGPQQAELIAALGALAAAAGGRLLLDADYDALRDEPADEWQALRRTAHAGHVCLVTPRVLLRAPYGRQNDMPDAFDFEECAGDPDADELLWGSAALLVATTLAQQFESGESHGNLSDQEAARDRPLYTFDKDGSKTVQPVAAALLSDREATALRERWGVMPVRADRHGNRLLFPALQALTAR